MNGWMAETNSFFLASDGQIHLILGEGRGVSRDDSYLFSITAVTHPVSKAFPQTLWSVNQATIGSREKTIQATAMKRPLSAQCSVPGQYLRYWPRICQHKFKQQQWINYSMLAQHFAIETHQFKLHQWLSCSELGHQRHWTRYRQTVIQAMDELLGQYLWHWPRIEPALLCHIVDAIPTSTARWTNVGLMLVQRPRRWTNMKPLLAQSYRQ